jgi:hypothetical protein
VELRSSMSVNGTGSGGAVEAGHFGRAPGSG